jgi:thymidylate synthase (FAD)
MEHQTMPPIFAPKQKTYPQEPGSVTLDPLADGISSLVLTRASGSDVDIVNAARVSYGKFTDQVTDRDKKLIQFLIEHNHTSPLEHNQLSFRVKAPLFVARQWMRHRMNSYNEVSYRYVQAKEEFYIPPQWRYQDKQNKQASTGSIDNEQLRATYEQTIAQCVKTYHDLMEQGVCRELARGILPLCTYTEFIFTTNLHSLTHFMKLRLHAGAQYEIRAFALGLLRLSLPYFPVTLGIWQKLNAPEITDEFTELFTKYAE